jgi:hypothetical protein
MGYPRGAAVQFVNLAVQFVKNTVQFVKAEAVAD